MTRVLKVQGAQSNTGCDKVAEEMMKEEKQGAKRLKVLQVLIGKLSFKS